MTDERSQLIYLLKIAYSNPDHSERYEEQKENLEMMKRIITINPSLTIEERGLLALVYKNLINSRRVILRSLNGFIQECKGNEYRLNKLTEFKEVLLAELDEYCLDLCSMVENKLLPITTSPEFRVYYEKLQADYYRYMAEFREDYEKSEYAEKANNHYEAALDIAKSELPRSSPSHLGLVLNYSVFLFETMERRQEALDLAQKVYTECADCINDMSDGTYSETSKILSILRENYLLWKSKSDSNQ